jgi:cytochrome c5
MLKANRNFCLRRLSAMPLVAIVFFACQPVEQDAGMPAEEVTAQVSPADQLLLASARVALPPEGTRLEDLPDPESAGAIAVQRYCVACHAIPQPTMHSATDWPSVARRMWLRMGQLGPDYVVPNPEMGERIVILDYLTANAFQVATSLPEGPGRQFFQDTCGQCHELPDPRQHSEEDWFVVVRRMNQHMQEILGTTLSAEDIERVVRYLASAT